MNEEIKNAIEFFTKLLDEYSGIETYFSAGTTLKFVEDGDGFNVVINDNKIFRIGLWEYDQIKTYVYCTICILREIWLGHATVSAD